MSQKYLPIGSVCTLKGKSKKVMITGYYSIKYNGNIKINDYKGCAYPEGLLLDDQNFSFNHSDIEKIDFVGYKDESQEKFMALFDELTGNMPEEEKARRFHEKNDMFLTSNSTYSKLLFDENGVVMIADPAVKPEKKDSKKLISNIKFDSNGTVISVGENENVNNPFHKEYAQTKKKEEKPSDWKIFNNIEFDEYGNVTKADLADKEKSKISEIKFDENGTVISVGGEDLKPKNDYSKYRFSDDGILISEGNDNFEFDEDGFVISDGNSVVESNGYKFDENGVLVAVDENSKNISQSTQPANYTFASDGTVVAQPQEQTQQTTPLTNIQFDENGTVVSA